MAEPQQLRVQLHRDPVFSALQSDRNRILDVFKEAISNASPAASVALSTMQEAMKPQKQAVLVQDENQLLENALRLLLQELVGAAVDAGEPVMQFGRSIDDSENVGGSVTRLLDIVLFLCEKGHVEGGMVFQLLEDLTEVSTVKDCKEVFAYVEGKQEVLGKPELFGRGKLVMLRTCNQLLRRLSKANDVVFCGRILMFLAHFFPLSERSAVNIKGVFNTSNETNYEKEEVEGVPIDFNFYKTFWGLQEHFSNPPALIQRWQTFTSSLTAVLSAFEAQPLDETSSQHLDEGDDTTFNTKYLTSSNLMALELKDPSFRRHVLVQCLIVFDYLKIPGKAEKEAARESLKDEARILENRVKALLEATPPKGKEFLRSIEHILEREKNWVWWKRDGCPAFEKSSSERKASSEGTKKRKQRWRLGNKELSQLWKWAEQNPNALTDPQRVKTPPVHDYWNALAEDMDPSSGIEAEYSHKNNRVYCWRGLRFSGKQDLEGFARFSDLGIEGVVPPELLTPEVRSKLHKPDKAKQKSTKKDSETTTAPPEENQMNGSVAVDDGGAAQEADDVVPMEAEAAAPSKEEESPDDLDKQGSDQEPDVFLATGDVFPEATPMINDSPDSPGEAPRSPRSPTRNFKKHSHLSDA